jgi:hypothetical protein
VVRIFSRYVGHPVAMNAGPKVGEWYRAQLVDANDAYFTTSNSGGLTHWPYRYVMSIKEAPAGQAFTFGLAPKWEAPIVVELERTIIYQGGYGFGIIF